MTGKSVAVAGPPTAMPSTCIDTADAIELAETLQLIARWLAADPERLAASLLDYTGHPDAPSAGGPSCRDNAGLSRRVSWTA
jgi:hypothetical protein